MKRILLLLAALALLLGGVGQARAGFIITFSQVGADVEANGTGTLNVGGLTPGPTNVNERAFLDPSTAALMTGPATFTKTDVYEGAISGPTSFGPGSITLASSGSGDFAGIISAGDQIFVPHGYVSGAALNDTATWSGTTLAGSA
jgi:hypothetical protein